MKFIDITGQRFGRLVAVRRAENCGRYAAFLCLCDCGHEAVVRSDCLRSGDTRSCGCLLQEILAQNRFAFKHGCSSRDRQTPGHRSWTGLKSRCLDAKNKDFRNYGGRGIAVCDRWLDSFENFLADMGPKPSSMHSIDRIDSDGSYEPSNCRWATPKEQQSNTRRKRH